MWSDTNNAKMYKSGTSRSLRLISLSWNFTPVFVVAIVFISISIVSNGVSANEESPPALSFVPAGAPESPVAPVNSGGGGDVQGKNTVDVPPTKSGFNCDRKIENGKVKLTCKMYTTIPTDIPEPHEIRVLDMQEGNTIQILTTGALERSRLDALTTLILKTCQIRAIERKAFIGGNLLQTIDLTYNNIDVLDPEVFEGLPNLSLLKLSYNAINRMKPETAFPALPHLTTLLLDNCKLDDLSDERIFKKLNKLKNLHLQNNALKTLNYKLLKIPALEFVNLAENNWVCDCHIKFLMEHLRERSLTTSYQKAKCATTSNLKSTSIGAYWEQTPIEEMICKPMIDKLEYTSYDLQHANSAMIKAEVDDSQDEKEKVKKGHDVYFDCEYSGYPKPEITWAKNDRTFTAERNLHENSPSPETKAVLNDTSIGENDLSTAAPPPLKPKREIEDVTHVLGKNMDEDEKKNNYKFEEHLIIRRVEAEDSGSYACLIKNEFGVIIAEKIVYLNVSVPPEDLFEGGLIPGGKKGVAIWMWILIGLLCVLILVLMILLTCLVWRRREKRKQEGFRKVMHDKFKDSNIDLGEFNIKTSTPNSHQTKNSHHVDGATPLLDTRSESSTILITDHPQQQSAPPLPDVALGNGDLIHNAQIFSPKPPPALHGYPGEARKEFFARQISEPYLRPGSAMSLFRPTTVNAEQKRYIFANQHFPSEPLRGDGENMYAVPTQFRDVPRPGSAMSVLALPEYDLRRQMFLRQYPQSQYATTARLPPRRISTGSEPPPEMLPASYNYSTLPRRPVRLQSWSRPISPTNSTCSTYSTLSWRPNLDPRTGVMSDGLGARNTAHGGSTTSINKVPDMSGVIIGDGGGNDSINRAILTPSSGGKVKSAVRNAPRFGHNRTPSSLTRGTNDFFSFEPIQEVESSECASTQHLDRMSGRQTPTGTQSLARGEPRYKRKKPPPVSMIPANLKAPSGAFDHLKGRSVSPALRNSVITDPPKEETASGPATASDKNSNVTSSQRNIVNNDKNNVSNGSIPVPMLESPIDETQQARKSLAKSAAPPPPPKPKRSQNQSEEEIYGKLNEGGRDPTPETVGKDSNGNPVIITDGTVV